MFFSSEWVYFIILLLTFACYRLQNVLIFQRVLPSNKCCPRINTTSETLKILRAWGTQLSKYAIMKPRQKCITIISTKTMTVKCPPSYVVNKWLTMYIPNSNACSWIIESCRPCVMIDKVRNAFICVSHLPTTWKRWVWTNHTDQGKIQKNQLTMSFPF